jgi:hypothetical protein
MFGVLESMYWAFIYHPFFIASMALGLLALFHINTGISNRCAAENGCGKLWAKTPLEKNDLTRAFLSARTDRPNAMSMQPQATHMCKYCGKTWEREVGVPEGM